MLCGALLQLTVHATDIVPAYLTGTRSTGASLYDGQEEQIDMHFRPDGYGAMAGSTPPMRRKEQQTLTCTAPEKPTTFVLKRREETIPADVEKMLAHVVQMETQ